jgi:hypothetical protein
MDFEQHLTVLFHISIPEWYDYYSIIDKITLVLNSQAKINKYI